MITTDQLTNTLFIITVLTITRLSVARSACSRPNRSLKFCLRSLRTSPPTTHLKIMFNRRLFNIVSQERDLERANSQQRPRQRTPEWAERNWHRIFARIQVMFKFLKSAWALQSMIGEANFKRLMGDDDLKRMANRETQQREAQMVRSAMIGTVRFIFGERVTQYKGNPPPMLHPEQCNHPNEALKLQGNKVQRAVYCQRCHARWLRTDLQNLAADLQMDPRDDSTLSYGKYCTWTYLEVYQRDPGYCNWTLQTAELGEATPALRHFAAYLMTRLQGRATPAGRPQPAVQAPRRATTSQPSASSRGPAPGAPSVSSGPMTVHLPTEDTRFEDIPLHIPNTDSTSARRRTFAETSVVQDAGGDEAMVQIGQETWEFPREPFPPSFGK